VGSSTHAAAVILFDEQDKLQDHCALMRAPNGDICTCLDLHTVEEAGCYKYDFLLLSTLDIQATCFKLLQKDKVIPPELTLKECFRTYINPNTINYDDERIWDKLYNNEVLSIFQWDAQSGRKGILATHPQNLFELTSVNGLIRLMTQEDDEDQIQRFVKFKSHPELFEYEMQAAGLNEEQRKIMHEELDRYNGCAATQESFMVLSQRLAGYSLKQADALRKTVAKKKMSEITAQHELFFEQLGNTDQNVKEYLWRVIIAPSLGYGFSLNHALPYSIIGVQCVLMGGVLFHPIYWQTACLLQRSGALDQKSADYNKIAKAVSAISQQGVNIRAVDINKSEREFTLDVEENTIYYGLSGVKGLREAAIDKILELRPFVSVFDYIGRTHPDVTSVVTLVKSGAFDHFAPRMEIIAQLARYYADTKEKLNGQNFGTLIKTDSWPEDDGPLTLARRVYNFTKYIKDLDYKIDDRAAEFLDEIGFQHNGEELDDRAWKTYYDFRMKPIKQYLIDNQAEMLEKVNATVIKEWRDKYFPNDEISQWEIETMGLCFGRHPLSNVVDSIDDFESLPQEPVIKSVFRTKTGREVPLFDLTMICGICIAKDKLHSSIVVLTTTGPVEVKLRKEQFAHYDAQISQVIDGKKKVIEKSWFNRGNSLIIHGMRQDDIFMGKTYKNSPMQHAVYKILSVDETGKCKVQKDRKKGKAEENNDE